MESYRALDFMTYFISLGNTTWALLMLFSGPNYINTKVIGFLKNEVIFNI